MKVTAPKPMGTDSIICIVDGLCERRHEGELGNPGGVATFGFVIRFQSGSKIAEESGFIGEGPEMDHVVAKYEALLRALRHLIGLKMTLLPVEVRSDSQQLVMEMKGQIIRQKMEKRPHYPKYLEAQELASQFSSIEYTWIHGTENEADIFSKAAYQRILLAYKETHSK